MLKQNQKVWNAEQIYNICCVDNMEETAWQVVNKPWPDLSSIKDIRCKHYKKYNLHMYKILGPAHSEFSPFGKQIRSLVKALTNKQ